MSLDHCLPDLERKGEIDVGRSKEARELYAKLKRYYERSHDPATAAALASAKDRRAARGGRRAQEAQPDPPARGAERRDRQDPRLCRRPTDPGRSIPRARKRCSASTAAPGTTIALRRGATRSAADRTAMITEILVKHRANLIGNVRNRAELEDVVRELFKPGSSGNENARELADAWSKAAEYLRSRYNEAGGQIGKPRELGLAAIAQLKARPRRRL
jgi:hypothetical protein